MRINHHQSLVHTGMVKLMIDIALRTCNYYVSHKFDSRIIQNIKFIDNAKHTKMLQKKKTTNPTLPAKEKRRSIATVAK